jgi:hypothetical protein
MGPGALILVRVDRGAPLPDPGGLREALAADRRRLALPPDAVGEVAVAGPYPIRVDDRDVDEYVVWER